MSDDLTRSIRRAICCGRKCVRPDDCWADLSRRYNNPGAVEAVEAIVRAAVKAERVRIAERVGDLAATALSIIRECENER